MAARGFAVADLAPLLIEAQLVEESEDEPKNESEAT
jgi:hypothetical protein